MNNNIKPLTIVMLEATGAVGGEVVHTLSDIPALEKLTLLGRREIAEVVQSNIEQH